MDIKLICSDKNRDITEKALGMSGISLHDSANLVFVERGLEVHAKSDAMIVFTLPALPGLIESLKHFGNIDLSSKILLGQRDDAYCPIDIDNIVYVNAINNNIYVHDKSQTEYQIKTKLYQLESMVLPKHFIRINKSEIINIRQVTKIVPMFKGRLIVYMEGYVLPLDISRSYTKAFKGRLGLL